MDNEKRDNTQEPSFIAIKCRVAQFNDDDGDGDDATRRDAECNRHGPSRDEDLKTLYARFSRVSGVAE